MPLTYPLMSVVQVMCARIGLVTGKGLAANIKANFHPWVITVVVALLLLANTLNIAADVVAMGEAAHLVTGLSHLQMTTLFVVVTPLVSLKPSLGKREFRRVAWDSWSGMLFSNLTAYFIILSTALTLHVAGVRDRKLLQKPPRPCVLWRGLQEHRLNTLFVALTDQPRQDLGRAIRACGLAETTGVLALFEQEFGIDMPLFLLTCRRAADDRLFRLANPEAEALVLPS